MCPDLTFFEGVISKELNLDARRTLFDNLTFKSYSTKIMGLVINYIVNLELLTLKAYFRQLLNFLRQAIFYDARITFEHSAIYGSSWFRLIF